MEIGQAKLELAQGKKVARAGWNDKGMYLVQLLPQVLFVETKEGKVVEKEWTIDGDKKLTLVPAIYLKTADDKLVPWTVSQTDFSANDYEVVE